MGRDGSHLDAAALLARSGIVRDEEVARAAVVAAARAARPFAEEGVRAALGWVAERWPDFTRRTVLPTLQDAVGVDEQPADRSGASPPQRPAHARQVTAYATAALAAVAAVGAWYRR